MFEISTESIKGWGRPSCPRWELDVPRSNKVLRVEWFDDVDHISFASWHALVTEHRIALPPSVLVYLARTSFCKHSSLNSAYVLCPNYRIQFNMVKGHEWIDICGGRGMWCSTHSWNCYTFHPDPYSQHGGCFYKLWLTAGDPVWSANTHTTALCLPDYMTHLLHQLITVCKLYSDCLTSNDLIQRPVTAIVVGAGGLYKPVRTTEESERPRRKAPELPNCGESLGFPRG